MSLILHTRPMRVPARAIRFTHTFGLGGIALVLFGLLVLSGVLMMFSYDPSPERAWQSVASYQEDTLFGGLVRGVHYWSANLLLPVIVLHLLRVFLTGGFHARRRSNWHLGLGIAFFIFLSGFTGYLLPWDQTAYWAITICTEMLGQVPVIGPAIKSAVIGGSEINAATAVNFYALHVVVTPLAMVALLTWHFWLIRTAGGVVLPTARADEEGRYLPFSPDLLHREAVVSAGVVAAVLVLAFVFDAPLGDPANPGISPNPTKAPWYFAGLQELLIHFDALFAVLVMPLCIVAGLIAAPFVCDGSEPAGDWFLTGNGRRVALVAAVTAVVVVPAFIVFSELVVGQGGWMPGAPTVVSNGLIPFAILGIGVAAFGIVVGKIFSPTRNELVQAVFVFFFVAFLVLTMTGVWFRGAGMDLVWPWRS
ncbi:MAG: cytochrome b N-terminal domain-containing protein [Gammaproteobacteria bacterium]|nr:cytochrome b N-terminal domain-containing protein [Gammaproteobacteria bacterium]